LKEFERVILKNELLQVEIIPELGAKIASLKMLPSGVEMLQQPLLPYAERTRTMAFDEGDASGFDECLPTVSGCKFDTGKGRVQVPDHGDFWRIPWTSKQTGHEVEMQATGFSLPLEFTKTLRLEGNELTMHYTIRNVGEATTEFSWSAHPLFTAEAGDRVVLPASVTFVQVEGSGGNRLGAAGKRYDWPVAKLESGTSIDLSECGAIESGVGDKLYTRAPQEGWCALDRVKLKTRVEMRFNPQESPFLGLWLCYGGWPEGRPNRQQCVALEPCMAPMDSLAVASAKGYTRKLEAQQKYAWSISIRIQPTGV